MTEVPLDAERSRDTGALPGSWLDRLRLRRIADHQRILPGHLAAALATPAVVIFADGHPARWAPLSRVRLRPRIDDSSPCRLLGSDCGCSATDGAALCLTNISPGDVIEQVRALLELERRVERIAGARPDEDLPDPLPLSG